MAHDPQLQSKPITAMRHRVATANTVIMVLWTVFAGSLFALEFTVPPEAAYGTLDWLAAQLPGAQRYPFDPVVIPVAITWLLGMLALYAGRRWLTARLAVQARLIDSLYHDRLHDALTGLLNRQGFQSSMAALAGRVDVRIVVVDLNDLKLVNDRDGHTVGDAMLVRAATAMRQACVEAICVARIGGDEFAVLSAGPPLGHAETAQRIRAAARSVNATAPTEPPARLAVGVAHSSETRGDLWAAYHLADERMYADKATLKASVLVSRMASPGTTTRN